MWTMYTTGKYGTAEVIAHVLHGTLLLGPVIVATTFLSAWLIQRDISFPH